MKKLIAVTIGVFLATCIVFGAQLFSDDFNRADAATLGANWTNDAGASGGWQIATNRATQINLVAIQTAYLSSWTGGNDQYAETQMVTLAGGWFGPVVRASTNTTGYVAAVFALGSAANIVVVSFIAGASTTVGTVSTTVNANDVVRLEAQGTTIRVKLNGVQIFSQTDATIASGSPGLMTDPSSGGQNIVDNFAAGDFSSGAATKSLMLRGVGDIP